MADNLAGVLRRIAAGPAADLGDGELLQRFIDRRDEAAFAVLVQRHGPMVLGVCRRLLGDWHAAEDAFQATFLVLARAAPSIRHRASLAGWLYAVARRVAGKARARAAQRRNRERTEAAMPRAEPPGDELSARELQAVLAEELARLPEKYRTAAVLCYLEGRTHEAAARLLRVPKSTLGSRLQRAKELLRQRLERRGVNLPAAVLAAGLGAEASVAVPARLLLATVQLAGLAASGQLAAAGVAVSPAVALAAAVMRGAGVAKILTLATVALLVAGLIAGAGAAARHWLAADNPAERGPAVPAMQQQTVAAVPRTDRYGDPLPAGAFLRLGTVRLRHGARVNGIAFAPDGRTLASVGEDGTLRLWDAATGRELRRVDAPRQPFRAAAFTPDGQSVVVAEPWAVHVWDKAGQTVRRLEQRGEWFSHVAVSPDGKLVAAGSHRHRVVLWELATGRLLRTLDGKEKSTFSVPIAFSADGRTLASGGMGGQVRLWDVATGNEVRRLSPQLPLSEKEAGPPNYRGMVQALTFSPDGRLLASCGHEPLVRLWDVATGKVLHHLPVHRYSSFALAFSPDGKMLAAGEYGGGIRLWEPTTGKEIRRIQAPGWYISSLAFSRDGRVLASGGDSNVCLWDPHTGKEALPDRGHAGRVDSLVLLPDQRTLLTAGQDGSARWWDLAGGSELRRAELPDLRLNGGAVFSPDGKIAALATQRPAGQNTAEVGLRLWDLEKQKAIALLWKPNLFATQFAPDGRSLFTQSWDVTERAGFLSQWDATTGKEMRVLARHSNAFEQFQLSPDGRTLAAVKWDKENSISLNDAATGKELHRFPVPREVLVALAFSPDGQFLAVADGPRRQPDSRVFHHYIRLFNLKTGRKIREFAGSPARAFGPLAFSPDGKTLAAAGYENRGIIINLGTKDNAIHLWEVATGAERLRLRGHTGRISHLRFAEHGRTLLSASEDTTVLAWDLTGGRR